MSDVEAITRLADRCEAARGADRELDMQITLAIGLVHEDCERAIVHDRPMMYFWHKTDRHAPLVTPDRYTASLDAAMTLVPGGLAWEATTTGFRPGASVVGFPSPRQHHGSYAATPALALCAAALRARAHLLTSTTPIEQREG